MYGIALDTHRALSARIACFYPNPAAHPSHMVSPSQCAYIYIYIELTAFFLSRSLLFVFVFVCNLCVCMYVCMYAYNDMDG